MRAFVLNIFSLVLALAPTAEGRTSEDVVILDETGARNLRIETETVEEGDFEETAFALGRLEIAPGKDGVVSSRISGRVVELLVAPGDIVAQDQTVARIESRQPGDPPPTVALKAPLGGLVMSVATRLGEAIEPGSALVEIADLSRVSATARVPEDLAGRIGPGTKAHIRVVALPGETFQGEMVRFGTSVDQTSGTLDAVFQLENGSGRLRPGMRAEYAIVLGKRENVMRVPRSALQGAASNRFLYVKHFDLPNAFVRTPVEVGAMNDRHVEILSGLFPADEVVTQGAYSLSFAGGGSGISLKEALDAAHGHEHAEDGSELTPEKKAEMERERQGHGHEGSAGPSSPLALISYAMNAILLVLLVVSTRRKPVGDDAAPAGSTQPGEEAA